VWGGRVGLGERDGTGLEEILFGGEVEVDAGAGGDENFGMGGESEDISSG
jgi:hypothetical protein